MNEREAMEFVEEASRFGIAPGLDNIRELCRRLGDPQNELRFIHVAGTNGKGSVSAYIASVLQCAGYRVGRYISPVIFEYRERIQVNGKNITKKFLCYGMERIRDACREMTGEGLPHPTPFEIETALGFLYFLEKDCDVVVLETGMGGELDATNIVENTAAAVLTPISMDHRQFLGNTLEKIATHKAGVIKTGCTVISACQSPKVMSILRSRAGKLGCPFTALDQEKLSGAHYGLKRQRFNYGNYVGLEISLAGKFQIENAALAVEALDALRERGFSVSEEQLRKGLVETVWPGRFTIIKNQPLFIVDGAHNEDAARRLAESIELYFTNKKIIFIIGVLRDKEYEKIISLTAKYAEHIIAVTPPGNPRALSAYELAQEAVRIHPGVTAVDSLEEAVEMSFLLTDRKSVVIAFGSLSYLGRLMEIVDSSFGKVSKKHGGRK